MASFVSKGIIGSLALVGTLTLAKDGDVMIRALSKTESDEIKSDKKKVLVLPFHRMKLVERVDRNEALASLLDGTGGEDKQIVMEVRELVDVIHAAAEDPEIVALYGTFEGSHGSFQGGVAQVQEVRNAIKVFNEHHRVHYEPKLNSKGEPLPVEKAMECKEKKSYAYAVCVVQSFPSYFYFESYCCNLNETYTLYFCSINLTIQHLEIWSITWRVLSLTFKCNLEEI